MLGSAESCTGGLLAGAFTAVAGSSDWFERGFVTYSNQAKVDELDVSPDALNHFGAVSEPVALEMATGVLLAAPAAHVAVSTTGIAGPGGATPGKPVGMVCFGFAMRNGDGISSRAVTMFPATARRCARPRWNTLWGLLEFVGRRSTGVEAARRARCVRPLKRAMGSPVSLPSQQGPAVGSRSASAGAVRGRACQRTALIASRRPLAAAPAASRLVAAAGVDDGARGIDHHAAARCWRRR